MIIPHEIIPNSSSIQWGSYYYNNSNISRESIVLCIIFHLHKQGKINDKKMFAMFKSLRDNTLLRKIGTYHCKINDTWYNDEGMFNILCEAYQDKCKREDLSVEDFCKYLNLYLNKNKNFCLNYIYYEFVNPLLSNLDNNNNSKLLRKFNVKDLGDTLLTYEEVNRRYGLGSGYCCEDCDGCYTRYKQSRYEHHYRRHDKKRASELFINYLNNLKTKGWEKNPLQLIPEL